MNNETSSMGRACAGCCRKAESLHGQQFRCLGGRGNAWPEGAQVITGAHDKTIRLWDIRKPATMATLTYHKKSVRALAMHPTECASLMSQQHDALGL